MHCQDGARKADDYYVDRQLKLQLAYTTQPGVSNSANKVRQNIQKAANLDVNKNEICTFFPIWLALPKLVSSPHAGTWYVPYIGKYVRHGLRPPPVLHITPILMQTLHTFLPFAV